MLLHFGADEFYCGVRTPEWEEHFGGHWWMNRRSPSGANLSSWEEVREVVRLAHEAKVPVHVCRPCAEARQLKAEDLIETAAFQEGDLLVSLAVDATVFTF